MVRSYGSVCATPLSFDHAGMKRIRTTKTAGTPTNFMNSLTASLAAIGGDEALELLHDVGGNGSTRVVDDERGLVQRQLPHDESSIRRLEGQAGARGDPVDERRSASLLDQGVDILDLPLHGVWLPCRRYRRARGGRR